MVGRFQPFTKGHYKCVEEAWKQKGIPTVICMIEIADDKTDERHPFPTSMMVPLYKEFFKKDEKVEDVILVKSADIVKIHEQLGDDYQICSLTCGTDRVKAYQWMYKYKEQAKLSDDFEIIEIKRSDEDISATKVRQALLDDDRTTFNKMTPMVSLSAHLKNDYFDILQKQIREVIK